MAFNRTNITKARQTRFVNVLTEARDALDEVIEKARDGDEEAFDLLYKFESDMRSVYRRAERMEDVE